MPARYPGKRSLDVVGAVVALAVLMPLLIVIAVLIRVESGAPVLFRQTRIGAGGRAFQMLKFRTLRVDTKVSPANDAGADDLWFKMRNAPRVTRMGRFLRLSYADALPQLVNVARGDMSLVGPRAEHPAGASYYEQVAPRRLLVQGGMTGLSQLKGRSISWDEEVRLDLRYVDTASLRLDLVILARYLARSLWALLMLMRSMFTRAPLVR